LKKKHIEPLFYYFVVMAIITGKQFNETNKGRVFVKVLYIDSYDKKLYYDKTKMEIGLNIDKNIMEGVEIDDKSFNPDFYFLGIEHVRNFMALGNYMSIVKISDDAKINLEGERYNCDQMILEQNYLIKEHPIWKEKNIEYVLEHDGMLLEFFENKNKELCLKAVGQNGLALQFVNEDDQDDDIIMLALKQTSYALEFATYQNFDMCRFAIEECPFVIEHVKDEYMVKDNIDLRMIAVKANGTLLRYIKEQNVDICKAAILQTPLAIKYVIDQTDELCRLATECNKTAILNFREPTKEQFLLAIQKNAYILTFIYRYKNHTFVNDYPKLVAFWKCDEFRKEAVEKNGNAIRYIQNPSQELCCVAVKQNPSAIEYIENNDFLPILRKEIAKNKKVKIEPEPQTPIEPESEN